MPTSPQRPSEGPQESPKQKERMGALESIKAQLASLRAAVERGPTAPESRETGGQQSAAEAMNTLAEAFQKARGFHEGLGATDPARQAWLNVEQAFLGNTTGGPAGVEDLQRGIEDAVEQTDAAQQDLAKLAGDVADEEGAVQEYLDRFRLSPVQRVDSVIDNVLQKARQNENLAPIVSKAENLFHSLGISFDDVKNFFKQLIFEKLESLPIRVGLVEDARLREQVARLTDAQKRMVTPEIEQQWRQAYYRWSSNPDKVVVQRPLLEMRNGKLVVVEPALEQQTAAVAQENIDAFGVSGMRLNQPLPLEGRPKFYVQVSGAGAGLTLGEVERGGKNFKFADKNTPATRITISTITAKNAADPGQMEVKFNTGEALTLVQLIGHLDKAIADQRGGEAQVEIPVGTRTLRASSGQTTA